MTNTKDIITRNLDRFGYRYTENENGLEVKHDFNLRTTIDLSQAGKVLLTDRLQGWNVLTGLIRTKDLKGAIRYTWIWMAVLWLIAIVVLDGVMEDKDIGVHWVVFLQIISFALLIVTLSGITFYLIKAESFRRSVMDWVKDGSCLTDRKAGA